MNYLDRLKKSENQESPGRRFDAAGKKYERQIVRDIVPPKTASKVFIPEKLPKPARPPAPGPGTERSALLPGRPAKPKPEAEIPKRTAETREPEIIDRELLVRTWQPEAARRTKIRRRIIIAAGIAALLAAFILPTAFFPKLTIAISPDIRNIDVPRTELIAETSVSSPDPAAKKLPAMAISADKTLEGEFPSSGTKFFEERARGKVRLFNAYSSQPQTLVAATRLQDPEGRVFRLTRAITVPGAEVAEGKIAPTSIEAEVAADQPGEAYNIGPTELRIPGFRGTPKYEGFFAKSEQNFSGGFKGQAKIVLSQDLAKASEELTRRAIEELRQELEEKTPADPDFLAPAGARETAILDIIQPKPGDRADGFKVRVISRGRLMAIRRSHLNQSLGALFLGKDSGLPAKFPAAQDELTITAVRLGPEPDELVIAVSGKLAYWRETNTGELAGVLKNSTPAKAEAYLRGRDEIASFRLKRFPRWLWFVPGRAGGLEIRIEAPAS